MHVSVSIPKDEHIKLDGIWANQSVRNDEGIFGAGADIIDRHTPCISDLMQRRRFAQVTLAAGDKLVDSLETPTGLRYIASVDRLRHETRKSSDALNLDLDPQVHFSPPGLYGRKFEPMKVEVLDKGEPTQERLLNLITAVNTAMRHGVDPNTPEEYQWTMEDYGIRRNRLLPKGSLTSAFDCPNTDDIGAIRNLVTKVIPDAIVSPSAPPVLRTEGLASLWRNRKQIPLMLFGRPMERDS